MFNSFGNERAKVREGREVVFVEESIENGGPVEACEFIAVKRPHDS